MSKKAARRGQIVPASKKVPQFGPHKFLIILTLVRWGGADLAVRDRLSTAVVPLWYRIGAALVPRGGRAVRGWSG